MENKSLWIVFIAGLFLVFRCSCSGDDEYTFTHPYSELEYTIYLDPDGGAFMTLNPETVDPNNSWHQCIEECVGEGLEGVWNTTVISRGSGFLDAQEVKIAGDYYFFCEDGNVYFSYMDMHDGVGGVPYED